MGEGFFLSCSRHRVDVGSAAVSSCIALERVGGERLGLVVDVEACGGELGREFSPAQSAQGAELDVDSVERALRCFELVDPELGPFVLELGDAGAVVLSAGEVELARPDQDPVVHAIPPNAPACALGSRSSRRLVCFGFASSSSTTWPAASRTRAARTTALSASTCNGPCGSSCSGIWTTRAPSRFSS